MSQNPPQPPLVADVGGPYDDAIANRALALHGSGSTGPEDMEYQWTVNPVAGTHLADAETAEARLLVPEAGDYHVTLTVTAGGSSHADTAKISFDRPVSEPAAISDDDIWWRDKFLESRRSALTNVQEAATKWEATLATVLGLFGVVAFVSAPTALDELPVFQAAATVVFVVFAFGLALASLLSAAAAGHGTPERHAKFDGTKYREATRREYEEASRQLRRARALAILAIITIALGTLVAWSTSVVKPTSTAGTLALIRADGEVYCGVLTGETGALQLDGQDIPGTVEEVSLVDSCPREATSTGWIEANKNLLRGAAAALVILSAAWLGWWSREKRWTLLRLLVTALPVSIIAGLVLTLGADLAPSSVWAALLIADASALVGWMLHALVTRMLRQF